MNCFVIANKFHEAENECKNVVKICCKAAFTKYIMKE